MISRRSTLAFAALAAAGLARPARAQDVPVIAAASDLQFALEEIATGFRQASGQDVRLTFGSTGNLARQIREGAPFQMFLAADEAFVLDLARDKFTRDIGVLYGEGRIAIVVPHGSVVQPDGTLASLRRALDEGRVVRFAIANPDHAPYGVRAKQALRHAGLWDSIQPYLVYGENVSQAAQFALSGNAEGGIVALSLALAPAVALLGGHEMIARDWHEPLLQRMVLLNSAGAVAEAFYDYMRTPAARNVMARYGFENPGG